MLTLRSVQPRQAGSDLYSQLPACLPSPNILTVIGPSNLFCGPMRLFQAQSNVGPFSTGKLSPRQPNELVLHIGPRNLSSIPT